jgi:thiol-disulfide isomerase/thioredoxin
VIAIPPGTGRRVAARSVVFTVLLLAASAAAGVWAYRHMHPRSAVYAMPAREPPPPAPADAGPGSARPAVGRAIPDELPSFILPDTSGRARSLTEWRGRPLVVNFWATWCEPCRREIPLLKTIRREHAANGLEIVGIAVDSARPVRDYAAREGIPYPILVGERGGLEAASAFGMDTVLPFSVFADHEGRIIGLKVGELHRDEAELILGLIGKVDGGKLTPEAARDEIRRSLPKLAAARAGAGNAAAQ